MVGGVADVHHRFQLFAGQPGDPVALTQVIDEDLRALGVELLDELALHVDFAGVAQHAGQRRLAGQLFDGDGAGGDRADHGAQASRGLGGIQPRHQHIVKRGAQCVAQWAAR